MNISIIIDYNAMLNSVTNESGLRYSFSKLVKFCLMNAEKKFSTPIKVSLVEAFKGTGNLHRNDILFMDVLNSLADELHAQTSINGISSQKTASGLGETGVDSEIMNTLLSRITQRQMFSVTADRIASGMIEGCLFFGFDQDFENCLRNVPSTFAFILPVIRDEFIKTNHNLPDNLSKSFKHLVLEVPSGDKMPICFNNTLVKGSISGTNITKFVPDEKKSFLDVLSVFLNIPGNVVIRENGTKGGMMFRKGELLPHMSMEELTSYISTKKELLYDIEYKELVSKGTKFCEFVVSKIII